MSELLAARGLVKEYPEAGRPLVVLDGLDLSVNAGEILAVTGPSGVGKSTLLHILGLLDTATRGSVIYNGAQVDTASEAVRARLRNCEFGFVFQFYHLLPDLDALTNVMLPAMVRASWLGWAARRGKVRQRAQRILDEIGLADRASHKPGELSGGEKQRLAIARALINQPKIVFCDEPTGNLDEKTSNRIYQLLWRINPKMNTTFVIVTHDEELASSCSRIARMHEGKISDVTANAGQSAVKENNTWD